MSLARELAEKLLENFTTVNSPYAKDPKIFVASASFGPTAVRHDDDETSYENAKDIPLPKDLLKESTVSPFSSELNEKSEGDFVDNFRNIVMRCLKQVNTVRYELMRDLQNKYRFMVNALKKEISRCTRETHEGEKYVADQCYYQSTESAKVQAYTAATQCLDLRMNALSKAFSEEYSDLVNLDENLDKVGDRGHRCYKRERSLREPENVSEYSSCAKINGDIRDSYFKYFLGRERLTQRVKHTATACGSVSAKEMTNKSKENEEKMNRKKYGKYS